MSVSGEKQIAMRSQAHSLAADQAASQGLSDEKLPTSTHAREEAHLELEEGQQAGVERRLDESKGGCEEQTRQQGMNQSDSTEAKVRRQCMPDPRISELFLPECSVQ